MGMGAEVRGRRQKAGVRRQEARGRRQQSRGQGRRKLREREEATAGGQEGRSERAGGQEGGKVRSERAAEALVRRWR